MKVNGRMDTPCCFEFQMHLSILPDWKLEFSECLGNLIFLEEQVASLKQQ